MLAVVEFVGPAVSTDDGGIAYRAKVDGETVSCRFSTECLQDVNPSLRSATLEQQFNASREKLLSIAEEKIRAGGILNGSVWVLTSDL